MKCSFGSLFENLALKDVAKICCFLNSNIVFAVNFPYNAFHICMEVSGSESCDMTECACNVREKLFELSAGFKGQLIFQI